MTKGRGGAAFTVQNTDGKGMNKSLLTYSVCNRGVMTPKIVSESWDIRSSGWRKTRSSAAMTVAAEEVATAVEVADRMGATEIVGICKYHLLS